MKLLAYTPEDRYAFFQDGDNILHTKPPHKEDSPAYEHEVEYAVTVHGFQVSNQEFETREALIKFLEDESVKAWRAQGPTRTLEELRADVQRWRGKP